MKKFLTTAAVFAALATPAFAQPYDTTQYSKVIENITAARYCGYLSKNQAVDAVMGASYATFGHSWGEASAYFQAAADAGEQDANSSGYCAGYSQSVLNAIRMIAADNGG
jgi:opacity protein-like surface antigen